RARHDTGYRRGARRAVRPGVAGRHRYRDVAGQDEAVRLPGRPTRGGDPPATRRDGEHQRGHQECAGCSEHESEATPRGTRSAWQAWHVSTLRDLVLEHTSLAGDDVEHLHRLDGDWQLISDLSFTDLLLWVPVGSGEEYLCVAQVRPVTAPTAYQDDQVGRVSGGPEVAHLHIARSQGRIWREGDPVWYGDTPARHEAIPVRRKGSPAVIAVVGRDTNLSTARTPSQLELNYLTTADDLAQMVADGAFPPPPSKASEPAAAPRVGDGLIRLDASGSVSYASPNAQSAFRRLGLPAHLVGEDLAAVVARLADDPLEGTELSRRIRTAVGGVQPGRKEMSARGASVLM